MQKCLELAQDCSMRAIEQSMSAAAMTALSSLAAGGCTCNPQQAADADIQMLLVQAEDATTAANAQAAQYLADANKLYTHVGRKMDTATAQVLQVVAEVMCKHFLDVHVSFATRMPFNSSITMTPHCIYSRVVAEH